MEGVDRAVGSGDSVSTAIKVGVSLGKGIVGIELAVGIGVSVGVGLATGEQEMKIIAANKITKSVFVFNHPSILEKHATHN
jgi:hypothetical protein